MNYCYIKYYNVVFETVGLTNLLHLALTFFSPSLLLVLLLCQSELVQIKPQAKNVHNSTLS